MVKETIYKTQSYLVKFDLSGPVDVNINVYHQDKTALTRDEIIEEALGYAKDEGIDLEEREVWEIETLELEAADGAFISPKDLPIIS